MSEAIAKSRFQNVSRKGRTQHAAGRRRPLARPSVAAMVSGKQASVLQQGLLADRKLTAQKLILTQGGEPTFVPLNPALPEWNIDALGREKLHYARRLARHLAQKLLPGAVVLQSFGKQYPGEPLPRWRLGIYRVHRRRPIWSELSRLLLEDTKAVIATPAQAKDFIIALARELGTNQTALPAYEDVEAWLRQTSKTHEALPHFSRAARKFKLPRAGAEKSDQWKSLLEPRGWVLPLDLVDHRWISDCWPLPEPEGLTLLVGDSPIGLRLPLHHLPPAAVKRALTAEVKANELVIFLPPLPDLEAFYKLIQKIERVTARLALPPLALQGYPPPDGEELEQISLMADPGVLEVNLPPAKSWSGFAQVARQVYMAAARSGLRGYKFQPSGRKVSTGGGGHIVFGGPTLEKNPFIQRPNLLSSFLRFVQNHPSLSYIFTGLFVGPSSQAPRVDESAYEIPYELEITLRGLEKMPTPADPAMIDAMLRNLLLDAHGNTHRAEISVDKFCNAGAPNGRLGLLEFRAFEMMPDAELFLRVNVLLRALAASFSEEPYTQPLIDWREALHDKFALPYFLMQDLAQVLAWLERRGFCFQLNWFQPHLDFRFPILRSWRCGGVKWELRQALEPWPVMGDGTVSRTVDASTDRLQLSVCAKETSDWIASVNGLRIPLSQQADGTALGAIRYRLFANLSGLQPQIGSHTPLHFEISESANGRVIEAFDYLNWKPEGGPYASLPASEEDAARRVAERVISRPDRLGEPAIYREVQLSSDAPFTLDLRAWS